MDVQTAVNWVLAMLPFVALAGAVVYAGYMSYQTAQMRRERELNPPGPDPVVELGRLHVEVAEALARSRETLEATRETLQRGIRG